MPSVCERCLPDNPYVQMLKEDFGAECKVCPTAARKANRKLTPVPDLHATIYRLSMEGRSLSPPKALHYLSHLRATEELLSMLHARSVIWLTNNDTGCCFENDSSWS